MNWVRNIVTRSVWVYLILALVSLKIIDYNLTFEQRSHYLLGLSYNENFKNYRNSIVYYDHLIRREPTAAHLGTLGYCYFRIQDYQNAIRYLQDALDKNPTDQMIRIRLIEALKAGDERGRAEAEFRILQSQGEIGK